MKFSTTAFLLSSSSMLASVQAQPPPSAMMACRDSESVEDFVSCFVTNANPDCVDESTLMSLQLCIDGLETPPADIRDFVRNSGCLDTTRECMRENAPAFGGRDGRMGGGKGLPPPIVEACQGSDTIADFATCFVANADFACVDAETLDDITTCIEALETPSDNIRDLVKNSGCFDTVSECMKAEMEAFMATLPDCLHESMGDLGRCIRDNKESCMATCIDIAPPVLNIDPANLGTCAGFQQEVMEPLCSSISCCEPCVEPFQDVAECMVAEYLALEDCEFDCPTARRSRELLFDRIRNWFGRGRTGGPGGDRPNRPPLFGQCIGSLRLESDADTLTEEDVADFVGCISEQYFEMIAREPMEDRRPGLRGDNRPAMNGDGN